MLSFFLILPLISGLSHLFSSPSLPLKAHFFLPQGQPLLFYRKNGRPMLQNGGWEKLDVPCIGITGCTATRNIPVL